MTHTAASRLPEPEHGETGHAVHVHHKVPYVLIFCLLVALTGATVLIASHRFESEAVNVLLALIIASVKATLVAMFFMHLKFEGKLIYIIATVPLILCVLLVCALIPDIMYGHPMSGAGHMIHEFLSTFGLGEAPH